MGLEMFLAITVPLASFFILKRKMSIENSGAIAASYGSVSAVTFVTATSFLDFESVKFNGHMIAVMALMEVPAIIVGVLLINYFKGNEKKEQFGVSKLLWHSVTNGSVFLCWIWVLQAGDSSRLF